MKRDRTNHAHINNPMIPLSHQAPKDAFNEISNQQIISSNHALRNSND